MPAFNLAALLGLLGERPGREDGAGVGELVDDTTRLYQALLNRDVARSLAARVLEALSDAGWLEPGALAASDVSELRAFLRAARFKLSDTTLARLKRLAGWVDLMRAEDAAAFIGEGVDTETLRESLRALPGLGPATVDALLLHGLGRAAFPVERAGYRILARHGWVDFEAGYDAAREVVESAASGEIAILSATQAAFDHVGRDFCRARLPQCEHCPLRPLLPASGPLGDGLE